jgi:outer membrane protein OmpA-like peptidoglycan-associated protein
VQATAAAERETEQKALQKAKADAERADAAARTERQAAEQARAAQATAASQAAAAADQANAARQAAERAAKERDQARAQLQTSLSGILDTTRTARGLVVNLGDVLFDTGKATLRPEAREKLSRLSGILLAYPAPYTLTFEGHTDSVGSDAVNDSLSQARAEAVRDYIVSAGVGGERVVGTKGFGKNEPVATNDTAEGRAKNRRVEIVINDSAQQTTTLKQP